HAAHARITANVGINRTYWERWTNGLRANNRALTAAGTSARRMRVRNPAIRDRQTGIFGDAWSGTPLSGPAEGPVEIRAASVCQRDGTTRTRRTWCPLRGRLAGRSRTGAPRASAQLNGNPRPPRPQTPTAHR